MMRAVLHAWLPWLAVLLACFLVAYLLVRWNRARPSFRRLRQLHSDEGGAVQSLSFVLTLPFFIMVILLIVQVSQLMIGIVVVHYAAYASARSASVWIPARLPDPEHENCISSYSLDPDAPDQVFPILNPEDPNYGPAEGGMTYVVHPGSPKYNKIASAAVLACMPISPSRPLGFDLRADAPMAAEVLKSLYASMAPESTANAKIPQRLHNKLAYSANNTFVEMRFYHKNEEPPLTTCVIPDALEEFAYNELGWQDQVTIKVTHNMVLLPGAGRLLAGYILGYRGSDSSASPETGGSPGGVQRREGYYTYPLHASIRMDIEGEKLVIPYTYEVF